MLRSYGWLFSRPPTGTSRRFYPTTPALKTPKQRQRPTRSLGVEEFEKGARSKSKPESTKYHSPNGTESLPSDEVPSGLTRIRPLELQEHCGNDEIVKLDGKAQDVSEPSEALAALTKPKPAKRAQRRQPNNTVPPRLIVASLEKHDDLPSFLAYVGRTGLSRKSSVYKGTLFEYSVAETLKRYNFSLRRTGRANDLGIDLMGHWELPGQPKNHPLRVLIQCKASESAKPAPSMVRELEGAYRGAPSGWQCEDGVLALLITTQPTTSGVRAAIQRSKSPMAVMQVTKDQGEVKQLVWNASASRAGLEGLGVVIKYKQGGDKGVEKRVDWCLGLTWMEKPWMPSRISRIADQ